MGEKQVATWDDMLEFYVAAKLDRVYFVMLVELLDPQRVDYWVD